MIKDFVWLERVKPGDIAELIQKAKDEQHGVFVPTHKVIKEGQMQGYFSVGSPGFPIVFAWLGKELNARESFSLINTIENHVSLAGAEGVCFPVPKISPFHHLMENMGYHNTSDYSFFVKKF